MTEALKIPRAVLDRAAELVGEHLGLYYPASRYPDLERGIRKACQEHDFSALSSCVDWMASAPAGEVVDVLARKLTIGETYFFRDRPLMRSLEDIVLPELITARSDSRRLRIWSAACSSGEEPYTLAIMLDRLLPDISRWDIRIWATDINSEFLSRARRAVYRQWSFRGGPPWLLNGYFHPCAGGLFQLDDRIREMVSFRQYNLMSGTGFPDGPQLGDVDLLLCRNVLIYFSSETVRDVLLRLQRYLASDGWFATSPSEAAHVLETGLLSPRPAGESLLFVADGHSSEPVTDYRERSLPGEAAADAQAVREDVVFNENDGETSYYDDAELSALPPVPSDMPDSPPPAEMDFEGMLLDAEAAAQSGNAVRARTILGTVIASDRASSFQLSEALSRLAAITADHGSLDDAVALCERALEADSLNPHAHYLRASLFREQGEDEKARQALQRAIFLKQDFIMARYSLATLARAMGRIAEASREFRNSVGLLQAMPEDMEIPHSDGLTAGQLKEIVEQSAGVS